MDAVAGHIVRTDGANRSEVMCVICGAHHSWIGIWDLWPEWRTRHEECGAVGRAHSCSYCLGVAVMKAAGDGASRRFYLTCQCASGAAATPVEAIEFWRAAAASVRMVGVSHQQVEAMLKNPPQRLRDVMVCEQGHRLLPDVGRWNTNSLRTRRFVFMCGEHFMAVTVTDADLHRLRTMDAVVDFFVHAFMNAQKPAQMARSTDARAPEVLWKSAPYAREGVSDSGMPLPGVSTGARGPRLLPRIVLRVDDPNGDDVAEDV